MSINDRKRLLEIFFESHRHLANIDDIFFHVMRENFIATLPNKPDIDALISNKQSYNIDVTIGNQTFTVPWMTPDGSFIINGVERVPLIQEVKARNIIFISSMSNEKGSFVVASTRFPDAKFPARLVLKASEIYLDVSAISRQLDEEDDESSGSIVKVPFAAILDIFGVNLAYVRDTLGEMGANDATFSMLFASLKHIGIDNIPSKKVLVDNLFKLETFDDNLVNTIIVDTMLRLLDEAVMVYFGKEPTDRDNYANKLLKTSGDIIGPIISDVVSRKTSNFARALESKLMPMMRTGNITIGKRVYPKMVVQVTKRSTFDAISSIRRITIPCDENSASAAMRQLHPSQNGFVCLNETPEGKTTGLVKNLALTCVISPKLNTKKILRNVLRWISHHKENVDDNRIWIIFDGIVVGFFFDAYEKFRDEMKRKYAYVSISRPNKFIVDVRTWCGRPMRPLLKVGKYPIDWRQMDECKTWKDIIARGLAEYLDPSETNDIENEIASMGYDGDYTRFKYAEIHPCTLFGVPASLIPFADHNQAARNIFASSMVKQAMQLNPNPSLYSEGKYLIYGQRPLVDTITSDMLGLNSNPNGINLVVCVLATTGYNMEDAIIVNKSSVDNGLFLSMVRNVHNKITDGIVTCDDDEILLVEGDVEKKVTKMDLPKQQTSFNGTAVTRAIPPIVGSAKPTIRDRKLLIKNDEYRELSVGDKIASRHAQKGVIGRIMDTNDMPFTGDGIRPDIIFNPHGIPSRMTMGQLLEGVVGTQCAIDGTFFDGTPFNGDLDIDAIAKMERDNARDLYSGMSGEHMGEHHLGTIYYMPLKHQSKDKVYVRWTGPNELFSRQPVAGKKRGGGLKFGEMEMDAMISHGAANAILDTIRQSDMCDMPFCDTCGLFPAIGKDKCKTCESPIVVKEVPYSLKVFSDLSKCANMLLQVHLDKE